jgi:UDP-glucose 6-dehydrogenase
LNIIFIGTGSAGLVCCDCLSDVGIKVSFVNFGHNNMDDLKNDILPIYESSFKDMVLCNFEKSRFKYSQILNQGDSWIKIKVRHHDARAKDVDS